MNCTIGLIDKKINSTKTSFSSQSTHTVVAKDPVSRENPKILVTGTPLQKSNYMSFNGWYYWIDDITENTNGTFWVSGHVDPLGTFKSDIKSTSAYVNFGPSSMWNKLVCDTRCVPELEESIETTPATWDIFDYTNGCVVMSVIDFGDGQDYGALQGGLHWIVGDYAAFKVCMSYYGADVLSALSNPLIPLGAATDNLVGALTGFGQAKDYIRSAVWVPFKLSSVTTGLSAYTGGIGPYRIYGTWYELGELGAGCIDGGSKNVVIPYPTICSTYWWLKSPQYSTVLCSTPGGIHDISTSDDVNETVGFRTVDANLYYSPTSGDVMIVIRDSSGDILDVAQWNCAVDVMNRTEHPGISAAQVGITQGLKLGSMAVAGISAGAAALSSGVGAAGASAWESGALGQGRALGNLSQSMAKEAGIGQNVSMLSSGVGGVFKAATMSEGGRHISLAPSISNIYINKDFVTLQLICKTFVPTTIKNGTYETWCGEYGYPVYDYKTLSVNGYYECAGASCKTTAPQHLASTINSYLNSGIYIE